jgi:deoxyribodipyrimidine photo-lyase
MSLIIQWFRQDLRISDNPALFAAVNKGEVLPIYT